MARRELQRQRFGRGADGRMVSHHGRDGDRQNERRRREINWVPLFRDADPGTVDAALSACEVLLVPAGTPLLKPGEINRNVYIPLSGEIAAHLDAGLNPHAAIPIPVGECIGELSAIDGKPASALVVAMTDARVLELPGSVFWDQLMALPGVARNLMITLSERMRVSNERSLQAQREQLELIHLRKELDVARQLQVSMLPLQRPLFPEQEDIEACGFMEPAADVGGDLFDAFFIDDRRLFLCIGDVSGHGIAAALFMARAVGLLRILAMTTPEPDKLLGALNDRLCVGNDANIFVTLFCGFLDVRSGNLIYSNGGHCAPILSTARRSEEIALPKGSLIGAFPGLTYASREIDLKAGETLFCYTDGVTEAQNGAGEEFSAERCLRLLATEQASPLPVLLDAFRGEVADFTGSEVLADDCTMLAIRRS